MPRTESDLIDLDLRLLDERDAAIRVTHDGYEAAVWLPKSQIEFAHTSPGIVSVTLPQWLAEDRKLV